MFPSKAWVVVQFYGNKDILGCQRLDSVYFTQDAAETRARNMTRRHNWIWRAIEIEIPIAAMQEAIRSELAARGISTK